jgi:hypothetical protein
LRNTSRAGDLKAGVPTTNICLASGAALDFVDFGGDLACNWLELGEDA